jgi:hypothetical protein
MKFVLRTLAFIACLPVAMLAALVVFIAGCMDNTFPEVCDPVQVPTTGPGTKPATTPATSTAPATQTQPATRELHDLRQIYDPVHMPPPKDPNK